MSDLGQLATDYFDAWKTGDIDAVAELLAEDVTFRGPMGSADDAASFLAGPLEMAESLADIEVVKMLADDQDLMPWSNLRTAVGSTCPTANWSHVESGKITRICATFDPRPFFAEADAGSKN